MRKHQTVEEHTEMGRAKRSRALALKLASMDVRSEFTCDFSNDVEPVSM